MMPMTQLPKKEEIMASNNDLSGFGWVWTKIAMLEKRLFLACPRLLCLILVKNYSCSLARQRGQNALIDLMSCFTFVLRQADNMARHSIQDTSQHFAIEPPALSAKHFTLKRPFAIRAIVSVPLSCPTGLLVCKEAFKMKHWLQFCMFLCPCVFWVVGLLTQCMWGRQIKVLTNSIILYPGLMMTTDQYIKKQQQSLKTNYIPPISVKIFIDFDIKKNGPIMITGLHLLA